MRSSLGTDVITECIQQMFSSDEVFIQTDLDYTRLRNIIFPKSGFISIAQFMPLYEYKNFCYTNPYRKRRELYTASSEWRMLCSLTHYKKI